MTNGIYDHITEDAFNQIKAIGEVYTCRHCGNTGMFVNNPTNDIHNFGSLYTPSYLDTRYGVPEEYGIVFTCNSCHKRAIGRILVPLKVTNEAYPPFPYY